MSLVTLRTECSPKNISGRKDCVTTNVFGKGNFKANEMDYEWCMIKPRIGRSLNYFYISRCIWQQQAIFPREKTPDLKAVEFAARDGNFSERLLFDIALDNVRKVFQNSQKGMNNSRSLLVLHYNTHLAKYLTFSQWKRLIHELIMLLKKRQELFGSQAKVVWKTMTALGFAGTYYQFEGMYHTAFVSSYIS